MDLMQELERAIPSGPPLPPAETRAAAGRTALRRRRLAVASGAAVAVVALLVPVAALAGGTTDRGTEAPPVGPAPTAPDQTPNGGERSDADLRPGWPSEDAFAYVDRGTDELRIHPEAVVYERRDDVYPGKGTESVALDLSVGDQRQWILLEWDENGSFGSIGRPEDGLHETFDDFVSETTSGGGMTSGRARSPGRAGDATDDAPVVPADLPWLSADLAAGEIRAVAPGRVLDQLVDIQMPASFAPPGTPTAVALAADDEGRYLALFRGEEELVVVEATGHGYGIEELLAWARERYRSGEGLP